MSNLETSISEFTFKRDDIISENNSDKKLVENINQNGGGLLNDLFCNDDMTSLLLEAYADARPDISCYLLCKSKKCPKQICKQDDVGRNLLHYMTIYASHGNMVIHIGKLFRECSKSKIKKALNCKDKLGNTPLHYATDLGFNNLVKLYIDNGADSSIRNNKGEYVVEDTKSDKIPVDVSIIIASPQSDERLIDENNPILVPTNDNTQMLGLFSDTATFNTIHFLDEIEKEIKNKYNTQNTQNTQNLQNIIPEKKIDNVVVVDTPITEDTDTIATEAIIQEIINKTKKTEPENIKKEIQEETEEDMIRYMRGGTKKKSKKSNKKQSNKKQGRLISGERKITTYSEISTSESGLKKIDNSDIFLKSEKSHKSHKSHKSKKSHKSEEYTITLQEAVNSDDSNISDIARQLNRQSSDIHERVVLKIIELLKLDKNKESDMQKARNYKAAIYRTVKEKNPLLNNFDRAVEMEKSVTLETLKSINIDKVSQEIQKHISEKQSSIKSTESKPIETKKVKESKEEKKPKEKKKKADTSLSERSNTMTIEFSTISQF